MDEKWVAKVNGSRVLSVWANDEQDARDKVLDALMTNPQRRQILDQWQRNGSVVEKD